jgi:hypothetical protein
MSEHDPLYRIVTRFGLTPESINEPQAGYRNRSYKVTLTSGALANLIVYKAEPDMLSRIRRANHVSDFLSASGLPARSTSDPRILRITNAPRYAAIYHYLPGHTIPWEAYTMEHIKLLGATMSRMHTLLRNMPPTELPRVTDDCLVLLGRLRIYFAGPGVCNALSKKLGLSPSLRLDDLEGVLRATTQLQPQPLHMDFVRGNILFSDKPEVTGILDFEKTALGHPTFDIARTLAFLLVDCKHKSEAQVRKYFLHSGYAKRGHQALPRIRVGGNTLLDELVNFFLIHDFYKFLKHNPYEFLPENEHFVRTRNILLARGLLVAPHLAKPVL